jgi:hypothetical protein
MHGSTIFGVVCRVLCIASGCAFIWSAVGPESGAGRRSEDPLRAVEWIRPAVPIQLRSGGVLGNPSARLTILEFSDFECRFCAQHALNTLRQLQGHTLGTEAVSYRFRHFPLDAIHRRARRAAQAVECAERQNSFWSMHDALFRRKGDLAEDGIIAAATFATLEEKPFAECLTEPAAPTVDLDVHLGRALGISATPTFIAARIDRHGRAVAIARLRGLQSSGTFRALVTRLLSQDGTIAEPVGRFGL